MKTDNLPRPGSYEVTAVQEVLGTAAPVTRNVSTLCVTTSHMLKFASTFAGDPELPVPCRDLVKDVGPGRFSIKMSCDTPEEEIKGIPTELHGTYSAEEFEIIEDVALSGITQRGTKTYRRLGDC